MEVIETCMQINSEWRSLFRGSLFRLLPSSQRLSLKMEGELFIRITADAALEWISGISRHGRECFRISTKEVVKLRGLQADFAFKIGECEMLADAFAIFLCGLRDGVPRNVILRTDNRNVFHWLAKKGEVWETQPNTEKGFGFRNKAWDRNIITISQERP